jgi:ABC-type transporter Mla subunit MlaD
MSGMTTTSQEQSSKMIGKLSEAADKMGMFLNETVSSLSSNVQLTVKNMAEEVSEKQASLMEVQENSIAQTRTLLQTFNEGLDRLERMNEYIAGTMNQFQQAQGQISGTTAHLQTLTGDMKLATELFNKGQSSYATSVSSLQNSTQKSIDSVTNLLRNSGELSSQYVAEFDTIKQGLSAIFAEIQRGLTEYSRTVKASTQEYLDKYSTSLTNTTDKLSSAIQQQSEVVEMLVDSMNSRK